MLERLEGEAEGARKAGVLRLRAQGEERGEREALVMRLKVGTHLSHRVAHLSHSVAHFSHSVAHFSHSVTHLSHLRHTHSGTCYTLVTRTVVPRIYVLINLVKYE
jgi:hypothetical protein